MTFDNLLHIFDSWGYHIKTEHYADFKQYAQQMIRRRRMLVVTSKDNVVAVIFFFITNSYLKLYRKAEFAAPADTDYGFQVYIDKMICKKWEPSTRRLVQKAIQDCYPCASVAYYHRAPNDRCVTINRRAINVPSKSAV